ncbi:hypothetical protein MASR2M78_29280 [Treponema sp.]
MIVDDEYEIRSTLASAFPWESCGFIVAGQAESLKTAIEQVSKNSFDAVLCDIRMGGGSGLDFARWSHEQNKSYRIVFLSAYRKFEYAQEALTYGVHSYIVKPPDLNEIIRVFSDIREDIEAASGKPCCSESVVSIVKSYVEGNYAHASIEGAARLVRMNSHYLSSYFKEKSGQTFSALLLDTRMSRAGELLREGRYKTLEISTMVGYTDPKNFVRAFKRWSGKSPREFKNLQEQ